jgi:hypothetical protein
MSHSAPLCMPCKSSVNGRIPGTFASIRRTHLHNQIDVHSTTLLENHARPPPEQRRLSEILQRAANAALSKARGRTQIHTTMSAVCLRSTIIRWPCVCCTVWPAAFDVTTYADICNQYCQQLGVGTGVLRQLLCSRDSSFPFRESRSERST